MIRTRQKSKPPTEKLEQNLIKEVDRMKKAEKEQATLVAQTIYLGTLGLIFVLPIIAGAYFGRWVDGHYAGYSVRWTVSFIVLGIGVGIFNVYLFLKE